MSDKKILEKAINKAIDGGWDIRSHWISMYSRKEMLPYIINPKFTNSLIFDHDFAKALWGDGVYVYELPLWKDNLQKMVIADNPIQYLGEHLDA